ncbi:MAG TPA: hypothetical protein VID48_12105 [Solirubrobacteraceae bacterium]
MLEGVPAVGVDAVAEGVEALEVSVDCDVVALVWFAGSVTETVDGLLELPQPASSTTSAIDERALAPAKRVLVLDALIVLCMGTLLWALLIEIVCLLTALISGYFPELAFCSLHLVSAASLSASLSLAG